MVNLKNFRLYTPDDPERDYLVEMGMAFYIDDAGNDWHLSQAKYRSDTLKFAYRSDGYIESFSYDVTAITPRDVSVAEIRTQDIPDGFFDGGRWIFDGKKITAYQSTQEELTAAVEREKYRLMAGAEVAIAPLQRAVKYGLATDDEKQLLEKWEIYTVLLSRVDTSKAPDIAWPEKPS